MNAEGFGMHLSVVVTAYNAERWIAETLDSILAQSHRDFELLAVDDGSSDRTLDILQEYAARDERIRVLTHANTGMAASANRAVQEATGDWIVRIDADDLMLTSRLERQIEYIRQNPDVVVASCLVYYINESGAIIGSYSSNLTTREDFDRYFARSEAIGLHHQGVIMRKDVFLEVGGYRGQFWPSDDMDLWNRMAEKGYVLVQPEYLQKYRIHGSSISNTALRTMLARNRWIDKCVKYRRSGREEPTWEQFCRIERQAPRWQRVNRWRMESGKVLYRRGTLAFSARNHLRAVAFLSGALIIHPLTTGYEIGRKFLRFKVRGTAQPRDVRPRRATEEESART
jgi:glycosyltransferase involved in cell wall biosynthesis